MGGKQNKFAGERKQTKLEASDPFPKNIGENAEDIAVAVSRVSRGMEVLESSRFKRKGLVLLISHSSKLPQRTVEKVLESLSTLERDYLK